MNIADYHIAKASILRRLLYNSAYESYKCLMEIFVQDCATDMHQPYFGNITKQKAKILFELQTQFLNFKEGNLL